MSIVIQKLRNLEETLSSYSKSNDSKKLTQYWSKFLVSVNKKMCVFSYEYRMAQAISAEPMKTSKQKQVNVFQKPPSVKSTNRKLVRCSVRYHSIEAAKIYAPKGKVPDICQELGVVS